MLSQQDHECEHSSPKSVSKAGFKFEYTNTSGRTGTEGGAGEGDRKQKT